MLKYLMMAGVVAAALTAGSPAAFAKNGSTFFANQPSTCHREVSNLGVVQAIWVGCKFKWWGGAFEPGDGASGTSNYTGESSKDHCRPPPPCERDVKFAKSFNKSFGKSFGKPQGKSFGKSFGKSSGKSFGKGKPG